MHRPRLAPAAFIALVVLASCFGGPPAATVSATLGPTASGTGPRAQAPFAVVFAGPRGTVRDLRQPAITILFNRGVHDPETAETAGVPAIRVLTGGSQPVSGRWRWVGSHGLVFAPDRGLAGSTAFSVIVPAGTSALDVVFNEPMDPEVVASSARIVARPEGGQAAPVAPRSLAFRASRPAFGP